MPFSVNRIGLFGCVLVGCRWGGGGNGCWGGVFIWDAIFGGFCLSGFVGGFVSFCLGSGVVGDVHVLFGKWHLYLVFVCF